MTLRYADDGGKTALHYCCCLPQARLTVCLLLKYGAHADAVDSHGNTALHLAAMVGDTEPREHCPLSISEGVQRKDLIRRLSFFFLLS